jgi:uncharacterized membrane protein
MSEDALTNSPSLALIQDWRQRGLISEDTHAALLAQLRPASIWRQWASWNLLGLGTTLVLAGIIFFFAYNWQGMGRMERLTAAQVGLFAAAIGSRFSGSHILVGHMLTLAACVMIGVFLAVFGQSYQTGADTYELFTGWAALMLIWVVAQQFAPLWVLWLGVLSTGFWFYFAGADRWRSDEPVWLAFMAIGALHLLALALREGLLKRGALWLADPWLRIWLLLVALGCFTLPAIVWAYEWNIEESRGLAAGFWIPTCGVGFYLYRYRLPSLGALGLILCSLCAIVLSLIARLFFEKWDLGLIMIYGLIVTGLLGALIAWLRALGRQMNHESRRDPS